MKTEQGRWATSGKSCGHYVTGVRTGPAACGAMPNNGLWRRHAGLTRHYCAKCGRHAKAAEDAAGALSSETVSKPPCNVMIKVRKMPREVVGG